MTSLLDSNELFALKQGKNVKLAIQSFSDNVDIGIKLNSIYDTFAAIIEIFREETKVVHSNLVTKKKLFNLIYFF